MISANDILQAHERIKEHIHDTPLLNSESINALAGCEITFKCENFQKVGAFKIRGAINAIKCLSKNELKNGVVTHSSGNHAQAIAKAAKLMNTVAYIVMPKNAPKVKVNAVQSYGGKITFCTPTLEARESSMKYIQKKTSAVFISPYDHPDIISGQATAAKEMLEKISLNVIIAPVGGGGLLAGTALASKYFANDIYVIGAEPSGADDAYRSLQEGKRITKQTPNTIADGLLTTLGELNYSIIKDNVNEILTVEDYDILNAMRLIWERLKIIVEPSCAVPLAAVLCNKEQFKGKKIGIILSGGNVDLDPFFNDFL